MNSLDITYGQSVVAISYIRQVRMWMISNILSQISSFDLIGYLIFKLEIIFSIVPMVPVKLAILVHVPLVGIGLDSFSTSISTWAIGVLRGGKTKWGQ